MHIHRTLSSLTRDKWTTCMSTSLLCFAFDYVCDLFGIVMLPKLSYMSNRHVSKSNYFGGFSATSGPHNTCWNTYQSGFVTFGAHLENSKPGLDQLTASGLHLARITHTIADRAGPTETQVRLLCVRFLGFSFNMLVYCSNYALSNMRKHFFYIMLQSVVIPYLGWSYSYRTIISLHSFLVICSCTCLHGVFQPLYSLWTYQCH